jgi:peptidoglycan/xylan/chitin deacetylase (PgdA/CDA1 family)
VNPDVTLDFNLLCVTPENFTGQLEWLREKFDLVSLTDLLNPRRAGPRLAVTFDDGYADNLYYGIPILERFRAPATVFVTTGRVDAQGEFWWDELERLVFQSSSLPDAIRIRHPTGESVFYVHAGADRVELYKHVHALLKAMHWNEQEEVLGQIRRQLVDVPPPRTSHRALKRPELEQLAASRLVSIGAHTVHHVCLAARPEAEQVMEVRDSLDSLRTWTRRPVTTFSYPFGSHGDISSNAAEYVAGAGCVLARANVAGIIMGGFDRFRMPGLLVRNWPPAVLTARLESYFQRGVFNAALA